MEPQMVKNLHAMVGARIVARIPVLDQEDMVVVQLHRVEIAGIWIESQDFNEVILKRVGIAASATALVLFIPFSGIDYILGSVNSPALSEAALGLAE